MKVRAKHWLNLNGTWHRCGEIFDLSAAEAEQAKGFVEILDDPAVPEEPVPEEPKKRRRTTKKAETE